ncbi:Short-chain dehydrogenase/reductase SDR [Nitzschia inconspicua]|uniref:Short-chain dehydrogenase/reductase SDR n=1 Tax=Nitzschia inconspicua TaxID=303405 RepID=A0A9K3L382_9STRA|nr:Short-chain dehydrogenase/reductase SDR [Nitzschia inconspicua]
MSLLSTVAAFSLQGKKALVTGSSGGIGKGVAQTLVDRGAQVVIHYNERKSEAMEFQQQLGKKKCLGAIHCDFRDPTSKIVRFMEQVNELCGGELDILVNNAGIVTKLALEDDTDDLSSWHDTMAVNLHAPNLLSKIFVNRFSTSLMSSDVTTRGVIINVSSIHGERSNEYMGAYAASKAALDSLTRTMAIEYAPYRVRVNAISPGVVPVERSQAAFSDPIIMGQWCDRLALQRVGTVQEVAEACIPLIENDWITGSIWQVDGGMMARANMPLRDRPPALRPE